MTLQPLVRFCRAACAALACATALFAADAAKSFDIPADTAAKSLREFSKQSGQQLLYSNTELSGVTTNAVKGTLSVDDALSRLLDKTPLVATRDPKSGAIAITREETSPNVPRAALAKSSDRPSEKADDAKDETFTMGVYEVKSRRPFTDANVDLVRTMNDPQPYYVFKRDAIDRSGALDLEDFLRQRLPMNAAATTPAQNLTSPQFGVYNSLNLRGLGANTTLILINGRRPVNPSASISAGSFLQADIKGIPLSAIDRVEVLPESASAIYGGSAMGGVINVVLKRSYTGGEIRTNYDNTFDTDAPIRSVDGSFGLSLENGRTRLMLTAHYSDAQSLLMQDRPFIGQYLATILRNSPTLLATNTAPFLGSVPNIGATTNLTLKNGTALNANTTSVPAGTAPGVATATLNAGLLANAGRFDLNTPPTAQSPYGRYVRLGAVPRDKSLLFTARREMTDRLELFAEISHTDNLSVTTANTFGTISVAATVPTNPFNQTVTVRLPVSFAPAFRVENLTDRLTAGFTLKLPADWNAQGDFTWNRNRYRSATPAVDTAQRTADIASGALNPFVDTVAFSPNLASFFGVDRFDPADATLNQLGLRVSGPLFGLPAGAPQMTVGVEQRRDGVRDTHEIDTFPNAAANFDLLFFGQSQTVRDIYAETSIPLLAAANKFPFARELELQFAGRRDWSEVRASPSRVFLSGPASLLATNLPVARTTASFNSNNTMAGLRYVPVKGVTLRTAYSTAFLPPSFNQFTGTTGLAPTTIVDPRRGNATYSTTASPGGNPAIQPQTSTNWGFGVILEPEFLKGLRVAVDGYRTKVKDRIAGPLPQFVVTNEALYPGRVTRGAAAAGDPFGVGTITLINTSVINIARTETNGFDVTLEYQRPIADLGSFDFFAVATVVEHYKNQSQPNLPFADIANQPGQTGPLKTRLNGNLNWERRGWRAGWSVQHLSGYPQLPLSNAAAILLAQGAARIPSQTYHSAFVGYRFRAERGASVPRLDRALSGLSITAGVKNIFDAAPPFDANFASNLYYSPFVDARLRSYWLSVRKEW